MTGEIDLYRAVKAVIGEQGEGGRKQMLAERDASTAGHRSGGLG